ncbi:hypothetical protein Droror1_Dr00003481 [Drosera rotundifolia]
MRFCISHATKTTKSLGEDEKQSIKISPPSTAIPRSPISASSDSRFSPHLSIHLHLRINDADRFANLCFLLLAIQQMEECPNSGLLLTCFYTTMSTVDDELGFRRSIRQTMVGNGNFGGESGRKGVVVRWSSGKGFVGKEWWCGGKR